MLSKVHIPRTNRGTQNSQTVTVEVVSLLRHFFSGAVAALTRALDPYLPGGVDNRDHLKSGISL